MTKLSTILDQIDAGSMLLPEFQRGYVWNRDQVRGLMRSLYSGYPVGALLVWETDGTGHAVRGASPTAAGPKQLLLDGQQRVSTMYGIIRGRPPAFFDGDPEAFRSLMFNVESEAFQFHAPVKMKDDPLWIDVTALFRSEPGSQITPLIDRPELRPKIGVYMQRLSKLENVLHREFHIEQISGVDKTVDVVVDIFNRVNSGGTKLSKGDLALARICAEWGDARPTMRRNLARWAERGYQFTPDWLLRNVNAVASGRAPFSALEDVSADGFQHALHESLQHIDHFLFDLIGRRLGLDHDRVLTGRYAFPVISRLLHNRGGRFASGIEADQALYWYVHAALRGRFAGSTETFLAKDLETVDRDGIEGVIASLRRSRKGVLAIDAQDFEGVGRGSRAYPLLYLVTRVRASLDLIGGKPLGQDASAVGVHEIFPKAMLVKQGYSRAEVNAIANFAFVTPSSGVALAGRDPVEYLARLHPRVLASQWIPNDPNLWRVENYREFLAARREMLADICNAYLDELVAGGVSWDSALEPIVVVPEADESDARAAQIAAVVEELVDMGYAQPSLNVEIPDPVTGSPLAVAEAFWSAGLQAGQGNPVVLELDPEEADIGRLTELGFEVFTSVDALRGFVQRRSEAASGDREVTGSGLDVLVPELPETEPEASPDTAAFDTALNDAMQLWENELGYVPRKLHIVVNQVGAIGATRRLLAERAVSDGFVLLWERQRLDLSVEALVDDPRFAGLFSEAERGTARDRLEEFGYSTSAA